MRTVNRLGERFDGPSSCRSCRAVERNSYNSGANHGGEMMFTHWGTCMAQHLTRNHVAYAVGRLQHGQTCPIDTRTGKPLRYDDKGGWWTTTKPRRRLSGTDEGRFVDYHARIPLTEKGRAAEREALARYIDRAAELWSHMPDHEFVEEARRVYAETAPRAPLTAPGQHHGVPESEEVSLW